ncbi:hypothetical protein CB0940_07548 [Cercospora beticola]|uniref:Uncharacterized protein n=1 Tax=Cercospora beticola TaxID=122368 RepID=A0A2G5HAQ1_CERBT|nr:hypothetical protein CB0940_07548 [Cercospora beticola]PIA89625.1 hypothetical protein CB0940_07548 [Cercospora beticola]WPB03508.1 hypothetical protein RHO25_008148 [Cercospora beticola]CAK1357756.1 unnamed protein product [Cercospora beticola]
MPERDKLSWLTPKRRRTTGNLKTNGHMKKVAEEGFGAIMEDGVQDQGLERPPGVSRPASQPHVPQISKGGDGGLFYAYARKDDDSESCYLLTFASAPTANEWWLLVQANFPAVSRPSPQLFTLNNPDMLSQTWIHPAFEHLRSRWMYIALSDSVSSGLGGAAQGIIPLQDAQGNMLGGSAPSSPPLRQRSVRHRKEQDSRPGDIDARLDRVTQMMERSTDSIDKLVQSQAGSSQNGQGYFDTSPLAVHFGKMTDLLARNVENIESMSKKQFEHEQRLTDALEEVSRKRREDRIDLSQLSAHLDRVNRTLDQSAAQRKDGVRSPVEKPPAIDFTPVTTKLEALQQAIEQNSSINKKILGERTNADAEARYKNQLDLLPISETLEKIHEAIEKQNLHTTAILEILRDDKDDSLRVSRTNGETLDRILQAQIEMKEIVEHNSGDIDFGPVAEHMDAIREATAENTQQIKDFIEHQKTASPGVQSGSKDIDFSPMTDRLDRMHGALERTSNYFQTQSPGTGDTKFLMSALSSHLSKIQAVTEQNAAAIRSMREKPPPPQVSPAPLMSEGMQGMIRETNDRLQALTSALSAGQTEQKRTPEADVLLDKRIEATSAQVRELMAGQREMVSVVRELALSITAKEKESCDHVVIPPPRKVGKKIVGFVYDGKEGLGLG